MYNQNTNKILLSSFILVVAFISCKKDGLLNFQLRFNNQTTISAGLPLNLPIIVPTPPITTNTKSELEGRNSELKLINSVKISQLRLLITAPEDTDFSFLKEVKLFLKADGLDEVMIAKKDFIPDDIGRELYLDVDNNQNLKEYVKKESFSLELKIVSDKTVDNPIDLDIMSVFDVNAGKLD